MQKSDLQLKKTNKQERKKEKNKMAMTKIPGLCIQIRVCLSFVYSL